MLTDKCLIPTPTPEGLEVIETSADDGSFDIREVGHFGYTIYQYKARPESSQQSWGSFAVDEPGAPFLAERLGDLDKRCQELSNVKPIPIDLQRWKWNRRATHRRLKRYIEEHGASELIVPRHLAALVREVIGDIPDKTDDELLEVLEKKFYEEGEISDFYDYHSRKSMRVIIVIPNLPKATKALLDETSEALFHGLFRASTALCRSVLEDLLRNVVSARGQGTWPAPIDDERLDVLINCLPNDVLNLKWKEFAHEIRKAGNRAMHDGEVGFDEVEAWHILVLTRRLVEVLLNRIVQSDP